MSKAQDLSTRFVAAVVMVAVACAALYFGGWAFRLLVAAASVLMLIEWADIHRVGRRWAYFGAALLAALLLGGSEWLFPVEDADEFVDAASFAPAWIGFSAAACLALVNAVLSRRFAMFGGFLYVAVPAFALIVLEWFWFDLVLWALVVTWATDIFAYFAGKAIGGPRLAPRVSPNKTWAGLGGGMLGAAVCGWLVASSFDLGQPFLLAGAPMAVVAQAGDLYESWVKRRAGVKDSGTILPGHGGVLDRLDGLLAVSIASFFLFFSIV